MAFTFMNMPSVQYPRSALLDFAPLGQAIDDYKQGAQQKALMDQNRAIGQTAAAQGADAASRQAYGLGRIEEGAALGKQSEAQKDRLIKRYGALFQQVDHEQDPQKRARMHAGALERFKRDSSAIGLTGDYDPDELDPMTGPKLFMAQAGMINDPLEREYKQAQINALNNKTASGGEAPSSVKEWQYYQTLSPEQREQFSALKRQNNILVGDQIINRTTGQPVAAVGDALTRGAIAKGEGKDIADTRAQLPEAKLRLQMVTGGLDRLEQTATKLATMPGLDKVVGGLYQTYASNVSEDALNAETELENLKVKISGVVLQSMRDASKTGGAVGQVTEREWPRLENMLANLSTKQGKPQFMANLQEVVSYAQGIKAQLQAAYEADVAKAQGGGNQPIQSPRVYNWTPDAGLQEAK